MRVGPGEYAIKRTTYSENRIVTIIPKTYSVLKCSCPATDLCAHLIGCQIFLGSFDHETKRTKNTTMTLKNNRKAADKTSGRKQPRKLDVGTSIHIPVTPAHINPSAINIEVKAAQVKYFTNHLHPIGFLNLILERKTINWINKIYESSDTVYFTS